MDTHLQKLGRARGMVGTSPELVRLWRRRRRLVQWQPLQPLILKHVIQLDAERERAIDEMTELGIARLPALKAPVRGHRDPNGFR